MERILSEARQYVSNDELHGIDTISSSALILDRTGDVPLLWHKKAKKLLFPGGKYDHRDISLIDIVMREVEEETGLSRNILYLPITRPLVYGVYNIDGVKMLDFMFLVIYKDSFRKFNFNPEYNWYFKKLTLLLNDQDANIKKAAELTYSVAFGKLPYLLDFSN